MGWIWMNGCMGGRREPWAVSRAMEDARNEHLWICIRVRRPSQNMDMDIWIRGGARASGAGWEGAGGEAGRTPAERRVSALDVCWSCHSRTGVRSSRSLLDERVGETGSAQVLVE